MFLMLTKVYLICVNSSLKYNNVLTQKVPFWKKKVYLNIQVQLKFKAQGQLKIASVGKFLTYRYVVIAI